LNKKVATSANIREDMLTAAESGLQTEGDWPNKAIFPNDKFEPPRSLCDRVFAACLWHGEIAMPAERPALLALMPLPVRRNIKQR
jgi:hypothetical protein